MIKTDKREKFIKRLNISKRTIKEPLDLLKINKPIEKKLEMDGLFDEVNRKYTLGSKKNIDYVKMEFKKFYE